MTSSRGFDQVNTICFLGIGGSGMRGLAALLASQQKKITGTDSNYESIKNDQLLSGYTILPENKATELIKGADLIIYSDALSDSHPLKLEARNNNKKTIAYNEAVGLLTQDFETTIAVTGTHGKSSTTAFLAYILEQAGFDPTVLLGASVKGWPLGNARAGSHKFFIVEADEYRNHFFSLNPKHIILTAIDFDHPDFFASVEEVLKSFQTFINKIPTMGYLVTTNTISSNLTLQLPQNTLTPDNAQEISTTIPGKHMQNNARLAMTMATKLGVDKDIARNSLATFPGLGRRFEELGLINSMKIISDYGHHPTEIEATLRSVRAKYPNDRILAIIEPHMEERLSTFFRGFVDALSNNCDGVLICPVYRARQTGETKLTSQELASALTERGVTNDQIESFDLLSQKLKALSAYYTVAIAFTAGELDGELRKLTVNRN